VQKTFEKVEVWPTQKVRNLKKKRTRGRVRSTESKQNKLNLERDSKRPPNVKLARIKEDGTEPPRGGFRETCKEEKTTKQKCGEIHVRGLGPATRSPMTSEKKNSNIGRRRRKNGLLNKGYRAGGQKKKKRTQVVDDKNLWTGHKRDQDLE